VAARVVIALCALSALRRILGLAAFGLVLTQLDGETRELYLAGEAWNAVGLAVLAALMLWSVALFVQRRRAALIPWTLYVIVASGVLAIEASGGVALSSPFVLPRLVLDFLIPFYGLLYVLRLDRRGFFA
jgi:hypothetical protein